jgi:hypothetical protein
MFCLMLTLIDLAGDEFWKAPPVISIGRLMHVDCWIGWNSVMCTHISSRATSGGSDAKFRYLLQSWDMSVFNSHEEDSGGECYGC